MLDMGVLFDKPKNPQDFKSIKISIASPEQIKEAIRNNEYPVDYDKVAEKLMENAEQLSD